MEEFMNGLTELVNANDLTLAEVVYALEAFKLDLLTSDDDDDEVEEG
jgi:hypothetical protein